MSITTFEMIAIDHLATVCGGTTAPNGTQPVPPGHGGQCSPGDIQCLVGNVLDSAKQRVAEARQYVGDLIDRVVPTDSTGPAMPRK